MEKLDEAAAIQESAYEFYRKGQISEAREKHDVAIEILEGLRKCDVVSSSAASKAVVANLISTVVESEILRSKCSRAEICNHLKDWQAAIRDADSCVMNEMPESEDSSLKATPL